MTKFKTTIIIFGDIAILYVSLILTLIIRYGQNYFKESLTAHLKPFSLIFIIWILIFYLFDLYKNKQFRISFGTIQALILAISISVVASIILFYLFPPLFKLTPKTNLAIFALIFGILALGWRFILAKIYISGGLKNHLLIIGDSPIIDEIINYLKINPQIGYNVVNQIKEYSKQKAKENIKQLIAERRINTIIIQPYLKKEPAFTKIIYQLLPSKINVVDLITFYETIFQKVPLEELEESWFIEKITVYRNFYNAAKRTIDFCLALFLNIIFLPLIFIIALLIKSTSKGPIIFKQERTGANNKPFILFKFRTMQLDAEKNGPQWANENDSRITSFGKILRRTHLDELPQLFNILKGDISFVGPRPERPEFIIKLKEQIPYYEIRHIIKPGLTGWAQINYRYGASVEDAIEKLQYEIYYLKNRSLILDFLIILKTIRLFFTNPK
ncbi:MAG: UDP-N-acetylgalactosamine-undecaprenyl-phosphate N-acetylgalactosaminephosphotransferase [Actinobacteria bacterium]|nr:UDP-N-acetylgalactosamine-undecaprenyl-phosphate N-acetylgalactosaminephosphotransferase [Actinomycetota bacterium]